MENIIAITKNLNVLCIDDDEMLRNKFSEILEDFFNSVDTACDGQDALEKYNNYFQQNNQYYDIVFTDIMMPKMDGHELIDEINKINENQRIVVVSAYNETDRFIKLIEQGIDNFLQKPIQLSDLIRTLRKIVENFHQQQLLKEQAKEIIQKNQELQNINERFHLAMESTKDGLWDWDMITNEIYFSSTWKKMLGYEDNEISSSLKEWQSRVHPDDMQKALADVTAHLEGQTDVYENIHRMKHKDGHWIWILDRGKALLDDNGKPYRFIGFHTDLTIQKEQEHKILEQAKMASLGEMIGNIAHQWRQPLQAISVLTQKLELTKMVNGEITDEDIHDMNAKVDIQLQYLSHTIDTFRNFLHEAKEQTDLVIQDEIKNGLNLVQITLKNKGIKLIDNIDYNDSIKANLVSSELSQVIINILNNAKDVLLERKVRDPWVQIDLEKNDTNILVTIEDNGGGIAEDIMPKIFEPYFTTKHQSQGTGLGLNMSYRIMTESINGKLYATNTSNGAKFFLEIPLKN